MQLLNLSTTGKNLKMKIREQNMKKTLFYIIFIIFVSFLFAQEECTIGVAVGKATVDGRPLLWKNRDTGFQDNEIGFFKDGKYYYIGIINAGDDKGEEIWAGVNNAGFAIINAESRDQARIGEKTNYDDEGRLMKKALQTCETVDDFEQILKETNDSGRAVTSNFGVIDAKGNGAIFETGNHHYTKFDASDFETAPLGFIVRSNFSFTGEGDKKYGKERHERAHTLFTKAEENNKLNYQYILQNVARDLHNDDADPYPLPFRGRQKHYKTGYIRTVNTINRYTTASVVVFYGVKAGENPLLTTMWVILGQPICGIAFPNWLAAGKVSNLVNGSQTAPINDLAKKIEKYYYPDRKGFNKRFLDSYRLVDKFNLLNRLTNIENEIINKTETKLHSWREDFPLKRVIQNYEYNMIDIVYNSLLEICSMLE